jgi:hypothetical protein
MTATPLASLLKAEGSKLTPACGGQVKRQAKILPVVTGNHPLMAVIISAPEISLESKSPDGMGGLPYQEDPYHQ